MPIHTRFVLMADFLILSNFSGILSQASIPEPVAKTRKALASLSEPDEALKALWL